MAHFVTKPSEAGPWNIKNHSLNFDTSNQSVVCATQMSGTYHPLAARVVKAVHHLHQCNSHTVAAQCQNFKDCLKTGPLVPHLTRSVLTEDCSFLFASPAVYLPASPLTPPWVRLIDSAIFNQQSNWSNKYFMASLPGDGLCLLGPHRQVLSPPTPADQPLPFSRLNRKRGSQPTRASYPMLGLWWASVCDAGPTQTHHRITGSCWAFSRIRKHVQKGHI